MLKVLAVTEYFIPQDLVGHFRKEADATLPAPVGAAVIAVEAVRLAGEVRGA